jgi:hypothetical protein
VANPYSRLKRRDEAFLVVALTFALIAAANLVPGKARALQSDGA